MIIGLCGFARAGKDEVAKALVEELGFRRLAFADALKAVLYDIHPRIAASVDLFGWEHVKENVLLDGRGWLQRLGVACREHLGADVWVNAVMDAAWETVPDRRGWVDAKVVISDVRFPNEIEAVRYRGGELWRIDRPGVGPANDHISEHAWADGPFDRVIQNSGTIQDLRKLVVTLARGSQPVAGLLTR